MPETEPQPRVSHVEQVNRLDLDRPHILVLTTDDHYAQRMRDMMTPQPFTATLITRMEGIETALQHLRRIDVVLVDVSSLNGDWQRLLTQMAARFQQASYLAVIEAGQDRLVEDLFACGVVDCLERHATAKMLQIRIRNVFRLRQLTLENRALRADERKQSQEMIALQRVMATMERHAERAAKEVESRIFTQVRSLVMPWFEEIAGQNHGAVSAKPLHALKTYMDDLASGLASHLQENTSLSAQEMRVALMVRNGMTSEAIAAHLHVSPETIKTHRRNIRRKFGLTSSNQKLRVYLQSLRPLETLGAKVEAHDTEAALDA